MFEIFNPYDRSRRVVATVRDEFIARLFVTVANKGRKARGLAPLDYAHASEPWL